jgi:ABC-type oligopeptide transport system substrate-binding subunit
VGWVRLQRSGWPQMMNRTNFSKIAIVLLALCFLESGCSFESGKATQSKPTRWNITQIEAKIKNWAKLKEIQLTDKQNGKYEGTGTGEDGLTYEITAAYAYSESEDNVEYEFHFDAEDTNGIVTSGTEQRDGTSMSMETKIGPKLK